MVNERHRQMSRANRNVTVTMESVLALAVVIGPEVDKQITWLQSKVPQHYLQEKCLHTFRDIFRAVTPAAPAVDRADVLVGP